MFKLHKLAFVATVYWQLQQEDTLEKDTDVTTTATPLFEKEKKQWVDLSTVHSVGN